MAKTNKGLVTRFIGASLALLLALLGGLAAALPGGKTAVALQTEPFPTADPLAIPTLPPQPTQIDIGRVSYYYNCMPCHGDHGQGLTDEWRTVWEEDHQNCWASGCHAGRTGDEGFPLPKFIPAVTGPQAQMAHDAAPEALHDYLQQTHPPQRPGALPAEEYWALTAYLLAENGRALPPQESRLAGVVVGGTAVILLAGLGVWWARKGQRIG